MKAPLRLMPRWTREQLARLREIEREFHVRAFGEELARVNLDMTVEERRRYLQWMRDTARKNGVCIERDPPYGMDEETLMKANPKTAEP